MLRKSQSKKLSFTASALALTLTLAACGSGDGKDGDTQTLRVGVIYAPAVPIVKCGLTPLSENKELSDAGLKIETIDSSQLGAENELLQQASSGELDIALAAGSTLATVFNIPELEMFEAYYLYDTPADVVRVRNTDVAKAAFDKLPAKAKLTAVGNPWLYGERHMFGSKALRGPKDFKGLKLRVPDTKISIGSAKALGASPTPTTYAELYLALQQGIVDAAEAPLSVIAAESFNEASKYVSLTGHLITAASPLINNETWDSLSAKQQTVVEKAFDETAKSISDCVAADDKKAMDSWKKDGKPEIVNDVDRDSLKALAEAAYSKDFSWSADYKKLIEELNE